jgi:glyoxylase-like metal-dependent hydrolase (beta-lactamase superfamily II)
MLDRMLRPYKTLAAVVAALFAGACSTPNETVAAAGPKLYIFDCGSIDGVDPELFGLKAEEIATPGFFTPCYLIVHPKGTLIWDTGQIPDANIQATGTTKEGPFSVTTPFLPQLAAVGYQPEQITYLALSHYHGDHTANANSFAGSTWLVQQVEHEAIFRDPPPERITAAHFEKLKSAKTQLLNGDHDVFDDGTVILKPTPGHTEGHMSLFLKLAKTGPILLCGDLYHYPEERTLNRIPTIEVSQDQTRASREKIEAFLKETGAELWIQHDRAASAKLKLAPDFYE